MSQKSLERQPLMDVGNLSQPNDVGAEKKAPFFVPAASAASQVIDLCAEADMTFAFNQSVLPAVASKAKTKAAAKPKVSAPKAAATAPKKAPAPKKAKKSKIDVEFDKLTPLEQLDFLKGKAQLLLQLEQDPSVQIAAIEEETTPEAAITTSAHATSSDDMQLCTLRLELGAVLSSEAEMRAKERKIRLQIKRLQRKMTMALPPIVVTHKETVPQYSISDALFVVPIFEDSSVPSTCSADNAMLAKNLTISTNEALLEPLQSTDKPLWRLAQQDAHFELAVAPRLLSVERDAVLLPEIPLSLAPSSPAAAPSAHTIETPHSPEHDRDASEHVSPVSSPCMVPTDIVSDVRSMDVCVSSESIMYAEDHNITAVMDTICDTIDIYEVTSSNESNAGDVGNEGHKDMDCYEPTTLHTNTSTRNGNYTVNTTSLVANLHNHNNMHCEVEEPHHKRQKLHNEQLNNNVLSTVRAGLFTHNIALVEAEPETSQSVLTQPQCKDTECVIDLCSPELLPPIKPSSVLSRAIPLSTHTNAATLSLTRINSNSSGCASNSGVQSIALSDSTPDCNNCIIHYVPSDYIESSSEEQYPSSSQPVGNALRSCISKRLHYSQQSEVNACSQYVPQSQSQASQAAMTTTITSESSTSNLCTNTTTSTSINTTANTTTDTALNILTSSTLPDFTTLSLPQIREIVLYYGLKEDSRHKMISLLRAMWCRVHGKKAVSGTVTATTNVNSNNKGCVASAAAAKVTAVKAVEAPQQSVQVVHNTQSIPPLPPQLLPQLSTQSTTHHQMLVSSFLTQSVTSSSSSNSSNSSSSNSATTCSNTTITTTTTTTAKPTTATRFELTLSDLKQFIRNHDTLYQQVLQYTPIELDTLHANIVSTGVYKVSRAKLLEMLDSLAIFVSNTSNRNNNSNKGKAGVNKGKKRKQLSQCSV